MQLLAECVTDEAHTCLLLIVEDVNQIPIRTPINDADHYKYTVLLPEEYNLHDKLAHQFFRV